MSPSLTYSYNTDHRPFYSPKIQVLSQVHVSIEKPPNYACMLILIWLLISLYNIHRTFDIVVNLNLVLPKLCYERKCSA